MPSRRLVIITLFKIQKTHCYTVSLKLLQTTLAYHQGMRLMLACNVHSRKKESYLFISNHSNFASNFLISHKSNQTDQIEPIFSKKILLRDVAEP